MTNPLHILSERYRRWRHSRGYGIHSPFAYRLVTEALHLRHGYSYYAETDPRLEADEICQSAEARALYRLTIFLRNEHKDPLTIYIGADSPSVWRTAVTLAHGNLTAKPEAADCLIVRPDANPSHIEIPDNPCAGTLTLEGKRWKIIITGRPMADTYYLLP